MSGLDNQSERINQKLDLVAKRVAYLMSQNEVARELISSHSSDLTEEEFAKAREWELVPSALAHKGRRRRTRAAKRP